MTTLRDDDIVSTPTDAPTSGPTATLPAGDADQGDSHEQQVDPAGSDPAGVDS